MGRRKKVEPPTPMWVKKQPPKPGMYFVADRQGFYAGIKKLVIREIGGPLQLSTGGVWVGWWWNIPIKRPPPPPPYWGEN